MKMVGGVRRLADLERSEFAEIIGNRKAELEGSIAPSSTMPTA
jgi:hypothetical protein